MLGIDKWTLRKLAEIGFTPSIRTTRGYYTFTVAQVGEARAKIDEVYRLCVGENRADDYIAVALQLPLHKVRVLLRSRGVVVENPALRHLRRIDRSEVNERASYQAFTRAKIRRIAAAYSLRPKIRYSILERDGFKCCACGRSPAVHGIALAVDHVVAKSQGGSDDPGNLQTLCEECNVGKGGSVHGSLGNNLPAAGA